MKTLSVVVAMWQRHELTAQMFHHTKRVADACHGFKVRLVAVGSEGEVSKKIATDAGWEYVEAENSPLSKKWGEAVHRACRDGADAVMILGSDDFATVEILRAAAKSVFEDKVDVFGFEDAFFVSEGPRVARWSGYAEQTGRKGEPMGMGRTFSRRYLELVRWKLWPDGLDRGLDGACWERVQSALTFHDVKIHTMPIVATGGMLVDVKRDGEEQMSSFERYVDTGEEVDWAPVLAKFPKDVVSGWDLDPMNAFAARRAADRVIENVALGLGYVGPLPRVGLVMIARDSEQSIARAIRCALPILEDVVVVVDDRTVDRTAEVANQFGLTYASPWLGFAGNRNLAHSLSPARWHLVLDADETMELGDIREAIARAEAKDADAVTVTVAASSQKGFVVPTIQPRILRKGRFLWCFHRHNDFVGMMKTVHSTAIVHARYHGVMKEKATAAIVDLVAMFESPSEPSVAPEREKAHAAFHLARSHCALGNFLEARMWARRCREIDEAQPDRRHETVIAIEAWCTLYLDGLETADWFVTDALRVYPDMAELHYIAVQIHAPLTMAHGMDPGRFADQPQSCIGRLRNFPMAMALIGIGTERQEPAEAPTA